MVEVVVARAGTTERGGGPRPGRWRTGATGPRRRPCGGPGTVPGPAATGGSRPRPRRRRPLLTRVGGTRPRTRPTPRHFGRPPARPTRTNGGTYDCLLEGQVVEVQPYKKKNEKGSSSPVSDRESAIREKDFPFGERRELPLSLSPPNASPTLFAQKTSRLYESSTQKNDTMSGKVTKTKRKTFDERLNQVRERTQRAFPQAGTKRLPVFFFWYCGTAVGIGSGLPITVALDTPNNPQQWRRCSK